MGSLILHLLGGGAGGGGGFLMVVIPRLLGASIGSFAMTHSLDSSLLSGSTNCTVSIIPHNCYWFVGVPMSHGFYP